MLYFLDTEFMEHGPGKPIDLISIGIVDLLGNQLYLENADADLSLANDWVKQNVIPHLWGRVPECRTSLKDIAKLITNFIPPKPPADRMTWGERLKVDDHYEPPEFWGYFADYDWVVFCQIFGTMMDLPKGYPMFCYDLKQLAQSLGVTKDRFPPQDEQEHHALHDARWNKRLYHVLGEEIARRRFDK